MADTNYGDNRLYEACAQRGLRLLAPRRRPFDDGEHQTTALDRAIINAGVASLTQAGETANHVTLSAGSTLNLNGRSLAIGSFDSSSGCA